VAVKKKSAVKKAVKKSPAKKTAAKKKSVAKKSAVKKTVAKKTTAKKKSVTKKAVAKKAVAKKSAVKKTTTKKAVAKKSAVKKATASKASAPVNVSTTPAPAAANPAVKAAAPKPSAAPRQGSSGKTLFAVLVAVVLLAAIVISNSGKDSDDAPASEPAVTESAAPEATEEATESAAPAIIDPAAATGEAPSRFIGNWKDSSKSVMVITWKAPAGDVTGYTVETRANMGDWKVVSEVSATTYAAEFAKTSADGSTSFRVSAVYADGSYGVAPAFGFAGQFE
jgi:hypothetical protein